jgi:hypothetical protein
MSFQAGSATTRPNPRFVLYETAHPFEGDAPEPGGGHRGTAGRRRRSASPARSVPRST